MIGRDRSARRPCGRVVVHVADGLTVPGKPRDGLHRVDRKRNSFSCVINGRPSYRPNCWVGEITDMPGQPVGRSLGVVIDQGDDRAEGMSQREILRWNHPCLRAMQDVQPEW